jgi:hypothetical protein
MDNWDDLPPERKIEVLGHLYFNRHGEDDWIDHNSLYKESADLYTAPTEEDDTEQED